MHFVALSVIGFWHVAVCMYLLHFAVEHAGHLADSRAGSQSWQAKGACMISVVRPDSDLMP